MEQTRHIDSIEIIIIDNFSKDETILVIQDIMKKDERIKLFVESQQGLSFARNRGIQKASSDWLLYLDDDAKLSSSNIDQILKTIKGYNFSLFTGVWKAWHLLPPPKWLPYSTGNYVLKGTDEIREIGNDYITGLIMVVNKQKLQEIGGFPTHLGMTGDTVAYGEETYVEEEFKKRGWKVGINPKIVIDHLVGAHKYALSWHLESAYAKGKATQMIHGSISKSKARLRMIKTLFLGWLKPLVKWMVRSGYYRQNFVIDYIGNIRFYRGVLDSFEK